MNVQERFDKTIKDDLSFGIGIINGGSYKDYDLKYIGLEKANI